MVNEFNVDEIIGHSFEFDTLMQMMLKDFEELYLGSEFSVRILCEEYDNEDLSDFDRRRLYRCERFINKKYLFEDKPIICYEDNMSLYLIIPSRVDIICVDLSYLV